MLKALGEDWISAYKPPVNFQISLVDAVACWLAFNPAWLGRRPARALLVGCASLRSYGSGRRRRCRTGRRHTNWSRCCKSPASSTWRVGDERNSALGRASEERVLAREDVTLKAAGRDDLARKVRWVSEEDVADNDIASFAPVGRQRLIDVKTTNGWEHALSHHPQRTGRDRRAALGMVPVPALELLA